MRLACLPLALCLLRTASAHANADYLTITCDAKRPALEIALNDMASVVKGDAIKIDPGTLVVHGPLKNDSGRMLRTGTKYLESRCGPFDVRIWSEFLNTDASGEMGAVVFAVVSVDDSRRKLASPLGFRICDQMLLEQAKWGPWADCPGRYASRIVIESGPARGTKMAVTRRYMQAEPYAEKQVTSDTVFPPADDHRASDAKHLSR